MGQIFLLEVIGRGYIKVEETFPIVEVGCICCSIQGAGMLDALLGDR